MLKEIRENVPKEIKNQDLIEKEIRLNMKAANLTQKLKIMDENFRFFAEANIIYQKFVDNRQCSDYQKCKIAIDAAKEFIDRYGDETKIKEEFRAKAKEDFKEVLEYLKRNLPRLEAKLLSHQ